MKHNTLGYNNHFRDTILIGMSATLGLLCLLLIFLNIRHEHYPLALAELLLLLCCAFVYQKIRTNKIHKFQRVLVPYAFIGVVIFGSHTQELYNGLFLWSYIVPTLFYLLFGIRHGFVASALVAGLQTLIILHKNDTQLYNTDIISINFFLAYIALWVASHIYETQRANVEERLLFLALKDPLTGAFNRLGMKKFVENELNSYPQYSIAIVDIDRFKNINDNHGHEAGDMVLQQFVKQLQAAVDDKHLYRLGGEEFVLILPYGYQQSCELLAALRGHLNETPLTVAEKKLTVSFSAGVVEGSSANEFSALLNSADAKLYQAKQSGRNKTL